jgi:hypothetical protein
VDNTHAELQPERLPEGGLSVAPFKPWANGFGILDATGRDVARIRHRTDYSCGDLAERLVACYNACIGVPTEVLTNTDPQMITDLLRKPLPFETA